MVWSADGRSSASGVSDSGQSLDEVISPFCLKGTGNCETMIPNAFHQNFYEKNTLSLRIIRKNDVHSNGTNIFFAFRSKNKVPAFHKVF